MKKQFEVIPIMNHGRWIFPCPRCKTALMADEKGVVCGMCWPNIRAKAFKPIAGGALRPVADEELIAEARAQAEAAGEVYVMKFPPERAEIESVLRLRKGIQHMNWNIGESVADLAGQNRAHGDPVPAQKGKK